MRALPPAIAWVDPHGTSIDLISEPNRSGSKSLAWPFTTRSLLRNSSVTGGRMHRH